MSIPVYVYVPVVLTMLGLNVFTVQYARRKIETLQAGLLAKNVLLGEGGRDTATIVAGGTMVLTVHSFVTRIRIYSKHYANLRIEFEDDRS